MPTRDPRVDAYIAKSAPFAQPILTRLRAVVHRAAPDIVETIKWGMPFFERNGLVCHMAAFKAHCAFGFYKAAAMKDGAKLTSDAARAGMGNLGRIAAPSDLPPDRTLAAWVREAVALNEAGVAAPRRRAKGTSKPVEVPPALARALERNRAAKKTFDALTASQRREYCTWIAEAKTEATRDKRLATAIEWLSDGKRFNWKYERR